MKRKFTYGTFILFALSYLIILGNSAGAVAEVTGAPGEQHCGRSGCHNTNANVGNANITIDFDNGAEVYSPDIAYDVTISLNNAQNVNRNGFEIVALDEQNKNVGEWILSSNEVQMKSGFSFANRRYVTQTSLGNGQTEWNIKWKSPSSNVGNVFFYVSVNDANGNGSSNNDDIYTSILEISSPVSSINNITGLNNFIVYPNPFNDAITIDLNISSSKILNVTMYNSYGKLVRTILLDNLVNGSNSIYIDHLDNLSNGLYFLQLQNLEGNKTTIKLLNY